MIDLRGHRSARVLTEQRLLMRDCSSPQCSLKKSSADGKLTVCEVLSGVGSEPREDGSSVDSLRGRFEGLDAFRHEESVDKVIGCSGSGGSGCTSCRWRVIGVDVAFVANLLVTRVADYDGNRSVGDQAIA